MRLYMPPKPVAREASLRSGVPGVDKANPKRKGSENLL